MSLKSKTISGVKWSTVSTITLAIVGLLKISVLARFLDAGDFGLMALVTFVLGFMNLFMDMGLTSAILHKQKISNDEYASLYWINIIFSFILFALIYIAIVETVGQEILIKIFKPEWFVDVARAVKEWLKALQSS